jgi:diaminopimelate epimerase
MNNLLNFSKMQALGNDFMVINTINQQFCPNRQQIQALSDRHFGIGFDQLLVISESSNPSFDYNYQIFNANGHEVGQCGNGARCAAIYIYKYLKPQKTLRLKTKTTELKLEVLDDHQVQLILPAPKFEPRDIPLKQDKLQNEYTLTSPAMKIHALSVGNPHAVYRIDDEKKLQEMDISILGKSLETHEIFPEHTNVNFFSIISQNKILLRVWERGCGETLACGSGAIATAVVAKTFYGLESPITVSLAGGELIVDYPKPDGPIYQIGPAHEVYTGQVFM